jgi:hypothetical protein
MEDTSVETLQNPFSGKRGKEDRDFLSNRKESTQLQTGVVRLPSYK